MKALRKLLRLQRVDPDLEHLQLQALLSRERWNLNHLRAVLAREPWGGDIDYIWHVRGLFGSWQPVEGAGIGPPPRPAGRDESFEEQRVRFSRQRPKLLILQKGYKAWTSHCYLVRPDSLVAMNRCVDCGLIYRHHHTCTTQARQFYFNRLNPNTRDWWQTIKFSPLGAPPNTKRLYVTYDIETYTWHGAAGKQLFPYLLVFHIGGPSTSLCDMALDIAITQGWSAPDPAMRAQLHPHQPRNVFYHWSFFKNDVGLKFKEFRSALQLRAVEHVWRRVLAASPGLKNTVDSGQTISPETVEVCTRRGEPGDEAYAVKLANVFVEIYIVGHNISGFDEVVLAAQTIDHRAQVPGAFRISRNFMPRQGKLLFNDMTYSLPNPGYVKREDFQEWEEGIFRPEDAPFQYVRFLVRDTYQLTHTSLAKAAAAYNLPICKTHCPYQAVNDYFRLGRFDVDDEGFPDLPYWKNRDEYTECKMEYNRRCPGRPYDIEREVLRYCIVDVLVTAQLVERLSHSYQEFVTDNLQMSPRCSFNVFQRPTISSNSHAIFRQIVYREHRPGKAGLGEHVLAPSQGMYDFVRQSIRGGRCYPTFIGVLEEPVYVYDICGMYASALTHPFPTGFPCEPVIRNAALEDWMQRLRQQPRATLSYFDPDLLHGIVLIDCDPPPRDQLDVLPPFCSRRGGRLAWTNESMRSEVATTIDVITLHNRGWNVRILDDDRNTLFPRMTCIARNYVTLNIAAKEKADRDKNQTLRSIAKLMSNALYGSFATRLDNRQVRFEADLDAHCQELVARGKAYVKSSCFLEPDSMSAEVLPRFCNHYLPSASMLGTDVYDEVPAPPPYIPSPADPPVKTVLYQPIRILNSESPDMCLVTLELLTDLVDNNRYPTHLASFVLAWTRAFVSEWACWLYEVDRGLDFERRLLKSVYGDTDSLFVTEAGRLLMESRGKHRIKKNKMGGLVYDPESPQLTWLVECETVCAECGADAYSPRTVFLAPKLYALQEVRCSANPTHRGPGKLRAKGHATSSLNFDVLEECYRSHLLAEDPHAKFSTSRIALKRTLASLQSKTHPFTVVEGRLTRILRPWKDMTLVPLKTRDPRWLVPYSNAEPNPRLDPFNTVEDPSLVAAGKAPTAPPPSSWIHFPSSTCPNSGPSWKPSTELSETCPSTKASSHWPSLTPKTRCSPWEENHFCETWWPPTRRSETPSTASSRSSSPTGPASP